MIRTDCSKRREWSSSRKTNSCSSASLQYALIPSKTIAPYLKATVSRPITASLLDTSYCSATFFQSRLRPFLYLSIWKTGMSHVPKRCTMRCRNGTAASHQAISAQPLANIHTLSNVTLAANLVTSPRTHGFVNGSPSVVQGAKAPFSHG